MAATHSTEDKSLKSSEDKTAVARAAQASQAEAERSSLDIAPQVTLKSKVTVVLSHYVDGVDGKPGDRVDLEPRLANGLLAGGLARLPR